MSRQYVTIFATDDSGCLLFTEHPDGQLWLPHSPIDASEAVDETYQNLLSSCNVEATSSPTLHIRSQSVGTSRWTNYIYKVNIRMRSQTRSKKFRFTALDALQKCAELRSDEIVSRSYLSRISEVQQTIVPGKAELQEVLDELGFDEVILEALATAIIDHVWPCERFSEQSFESFTAKLYGEKLPKCGEIFSRSVCQYDEKYADLENLSIILAMLEPSVRNSGTRCRFVFDFYNRQRNGRLSSDELDELVHDLHAANAEMQSTVPDLPTLYGLLGHQENAVMSIAQFSEYVRSAVFPGARYILRAPRSIYPYFMYEVLSAPRSKNFPNPQSPEDEYKRLNTSPEYAMEDWRVSVKTNDRDSDECSWWTFLIDEPQNRLDATCASLATSLDSAHYPKLMLDLLRHYVTGDQSKKAWSLGEKNIVEYYQAMMKVCKLAKPLLLEEKRMLELKNPVYVFGDLHGSYEDLLQFERNLWPMGPHVSPCSFVFIGDFVDRSRNGFLLMAHLLSCKILAPQKFFLVRGEHGDKTSCKNLKQECHEFLFESGSYGAKMFKQITDVFDHLPLAAMIDDRIFCVHGGFADGLFLPFGIEAINLVPNPLPNPRKHPLVRQILWLDPRRSRPEVDESDDTLFLGNKRRKLAQSFSREALSKFLERNRLSFVIRGHQYIDPGLHVNEDERLLSVFTPCHAQERPSDDTTSVLVDQDGLRLIRFTTDHDQEAVSKRKSTKKNVVCGDN